MSDDRPNILFIISDQHNAKVLGHAGHPQVRTPHLDRMAQEGVRFRNAVTQSPICTPSRMCCLSGQYPHNHGYYGLGGEKPDGLPSILGHFRRFGYLTGAVGKMHCPRNWMEDDCDLLPQPNEYNDFLAERGLLHLNDAGRYPEDNTELGKTAQSCDGRPSNLSHEESFEGWMARRAMDFMETAGARKKPFLIQVNIRRPHQIYSPSRPFWDMYDQESLILPPNAEYDMSLKSPHLKEQAEWWRSYPWPLFEPRTFEAARRRKMHGYLGCVSEVDHTVGELLDFLKRRGLEDNTIVIYTSDHGDYACEHGIMEKAPGICADAITRVPFIWRWPGHFQSGHTAEEIVETVDIPSTLCGLAGLEPLETADGQDLSPLLRGEKGDADRIGVTELVWSKSLRKGKYRLVYYPPQMFEQDYPGGFGELYNVEADPWEMENLYFDPEYADLIQELQKDLLNWLISTSRPRTVLRLRRQEKSFQRVARNDCQVNRDGKINPAWIRDALTRNYI